VHDEYTEERAEFERAVDRERMLVVRQGMLTNFQSFRLV
jgi:hypothetical protein